MSNKIHKYFDRNHSEWSLLGFLNESNEEPLQLKLGLYTKSLKEIEDHERGKRQEKARRLLDRYKKASKKILFLLEL